MPTRSYEAKINSADALAAALRNGALVADRALVLGEYVEELEGVLKEIAGANVPFYSEIAAGVLAKKVYR